MSNDPALSRKPSTSALYKSKRNGTFERSGSFGIMFLSHLDDTQSDRIETVKHEHGHYIQMQELGVAAFFFGIAIPSMLKTPYDYYNQKHEITADILGGVGKYDRAIPRRESAELEGTAYFEGLLKKRRFNDYIINMAIDPFGCGSLLQKYLAHIINYVSEQALDCAD